MDAETKIVKEADAAPAIGQARPHKVRRGARVGAVSRVELVFFAALGMIVLEGAFRKWMPLFGAGTGKYLMYFSKDIIFAALLVFPVRAQTSPMLATFQRWLLPGCGLLVLGAVLSCLNGVNLVGAVLTARAVIVLPLIAWLVMPRLAGLPLRRVAVFLAFFVILNFALGVEQNRLPPDHILNRYSEGDVQVVALQSGVRAVGTFSYIAGMALMSSVGIWAGLVLLGLARTQWQRVGAWATVVAGFGCGLASVSRAPIVVDLAMLAGWLVVSRDGISALGRSLMGGLFCLAIATGFGLMPVISELGDGMLERQSSVSDSFNERAFGQIGEIGNALQMAPWGNGFGTEQVGGQYAATGVGAFNHFESPLPRLVMETGAIGLLGYLVIWAGTLLALQQARRSAQNSGVRAALLATQLLFLPLFYGTLVFSHTASAFVWMIFAVVLAAAETNEKTEISKIENGNRGPAKRRRPKLGRAIFSVTGQHEAEN